MEAGSSKKSGSKRSRSLGSTPNKGKERKNSLGLGTRSKKGLTRKHKKSEHERKQKKMKFKLGGNKIDPLNLMGLIEKDGSSSPKVDSPLSDRGHKFEPGDVRPLDVTDPLKLNNLDDEVLNVSTHGQKRKRSRRKRRHTLTESDMDKVKEICPESDTVSDGEQNLTIAGDKSGEKDAIGVESPKKKSVSTPTKIDSEAGIEFKKESETEDKTYKISMSEKDLPKQATDEKSFKTSTTKKKSPEKQTKEKPQNVPGTNKQNSKKPETCRFREKDSKYRYGNYNRYYGYRNANMSEDERIENMQKEWFEGKSCLDIGCNVGHLTLYIARHFNPRSMLGIDIDEGLIKAAQGNIRNYLPTKNPQAPAQSEFPISFALCQGPLAAPLLPEKDGKSFGFPYNVAFKTENYVDCNWSELEKVEQEYEFILCLSVTKWVHLNWGDEVLKNMFKKMFLSLKPCGRLLLEPQPWKSYGKKKNITASIREMYNTIKFKPDQFIQYLLSPEVGFVKSELLGVPKHKAQGFRRPIYLLTKGGSFAASNNDVKADLQNSAIQKQKDAK